MDQISTNNIQTLKSCIFHPKNKIAFVQVNDLSTQPNSNIFQCVDCFEQDLKFRGANHMIISKIIETEDSDFHHKWPPLNDQEIIQKIYQKAQTLNSGDTILHQINSYFTQLKDEIFKKIDIAQKKAIYQAEQMPFGREQILRKYEEISQIKTFRELLIQDQNTSFELYQQSCKEFIQSIQLQKERNSQLFKDLLDQCDKIQDLVNFDKLNESKNIILDFLDSLSVFDDKIDGQANPSDQLNRNNSKHQDNDKIQKLMELISNKSNYCSEQFLKEMRQQLQKLSVFFDKSSFDEINQENKKPIRFSDLNNEKLESVNKYVEHLIKIENNPEYLQQVKDSDLLKRLESILESKLNFTTENFKESFKEYLIETQCFQSSLNANLIHSDDQSFDIVRNLETSNVKELVKIIQKKQEFQSQQQIFTNSNTFNVQQLILTKFFYNVNELENILKQFPIFDVLEIPKQRNILNQIQLFKGNLNEGNQRIQIIKNKNNQFEISLNENNYQGIFKKFGSNCVSQILERDKKYIFRIEFNKENTNFLRIGLMKNKNVNTDYGANDQMSIRFNLENNKMKYLSSDSNGICKFLKGTQDLLLEENTSLEMRVCMQEYKLEVLDYPNYNIQVELKDEQKNELISNDLCLYFNIQSDAPTYILKEAYIVDNF